MEVPWMRSKIFSVLRAGKHTRRTNVSEQHKSCATHLFFDNKFVPSRP
jgi:hypothetical protein